MHLILYVIGEYFIFYLSAGALGEIREYWARSFILILKTGSWAWDTIYGRFLDFFVWVGRAVCFLHLLGLT